jgi:hypothetical protein
MFYKIRKLKPLERALFALLIGVSVVSFWRGTGGLMSMYIFPNNLKISYWASLLIGLIILAITHYWTKELS